MVFVILLYNIVAKGSSHPVVVMVAGCLVFALAIPQNIFRFWSRVGSPEDYKLFIFSHGSLAHRSLILSGVLALQLCWMMMA